MTNEPAKPLARAERVRVTAERQELPGRGQPVLFGGRYRHFPIAQVPIEALVYRVENGRLAAEIEEHAAALGVTADELKERSETEKLQNFLHRALLAKSRDPQGPIFAELERLAQQMEPLLILFDGVVVNGNRRLAAMRDLLERDPDRYSAFRQIDVAVLPEGTEPREIEYVEAALQMAPETKLAYGWIDRRLKLRKQRDVLSLPIDEIKAAYRIEDADEIDREIAELTLAEDYLATYRGAPARYAAIVNAAALFAGLQEQLSRLRRARKPFWRVAGYAMIEGRDASLQKRLEQSFPFAPPVSPEIPAAAQLRLAQRLEVNGTAELGEEATLAKDAVEELVAILRDRQRSASNARLIADIMDELRLEHSQRNAPDKMLQKVREAGKLIAQLEPERLSPAQRRSLRVDLAALVAHGEFLLGEISEKPAARMAWNYSKAIIRPPYWKIPWRVLRRTGLATPRGSE